jgi:hypothetical protein
MHDHSALAVFMLTLRFDARLIILINLLLLALHEWPREKLMQCRTSIAYEAKQPRSIVMQLQPSVTYLTHLRIHRSGETVPSLQQIEWRRFIWFAAYAISD